VKSLEPNWIKSELGPDKFGYPEVFSSIHPTASDLSKVTGDRFRNLVNTAVTHGRRLKGGLSRKIREAPPTLRDTLSTSRKNTGSLWLFVLTVPTMCQQNSLALSLHLKQTWRRSIPHNPGKQAVRRFANRCRSVIGLKAVLKRGYYCVGVVRRLIRPEKQIPRG
jgi:hypothetical protein